MKWSSALRWVGLIWGLLWWRGVAFAETEATLRVPEQYATLAEAVAAASSGDTIAIGAGSFAGGVTIDKHLTIQGSGQGVTILDGGGTQRLFSVNSNISLRLSQLTLQGGSAPSGNSRGGAISSRGPLTVEDVTIENCRASLGAGIYNLGQLLTLNRVRFVGNQGAYGSAFYNINGTVQAQGVVVEQNGQSGGLGGAIFVDGGSVTLRDSRLQENLGRYGGAIYVASGLLSLQATEVISNSAESKGGAIYVAGNNNTLLKTVVVTTTDSRLAHNQATSDGGAIYSIGTSAAVTLTKTLLEQNQTEMKGGAIMVRDGSLALIESSLRSNQAVSSGGAIHGYLAQLTVTRSSLIQNHTNESGGAIHAVESAVTIENSTLSGNTTQKWGTALALFSSQGQLNFTTLVGVAGSVATAHFYASTLTVGNTIFAQANCERLEGTTLQSQGYNLFDLASCGLTHASDLQADPQLAPLEEVGRLGLHRPMVGSPAFASVPTCLPVDQLNQPRTAPCSRGAIESAESRAEPTAVTMSHKATDASHLLTLSSLLLFSLTLFSARHLLASRKTT